MAHGKPAVKYVPGIFNQYLADDNYEHWDRFPELMWGLGYEMDCCNSFDDYLKACGRNITNNIPRSREGRREILYLLEHADRKIVGNYLFSVWRYYTHWAMGSDKYLPDYMHRIMRILESKY